MDEKSRKLIREIWEDIISKRRGDLSFHTGFMETVMNYLEKADIISYGPPSEGYREFFYKVLPKIRKLERTNTEVRALVAVLFEELVIETISRPTYAMMEKNRVSGSHGG